MRGSLSKGTLSWSLSKGTLSRSLSKGTLSWSLKLTHSMVGQQETPSTVKGYSCQPQRPLPEGAKHDQSGCQQSVPFHDNDNDNDNDSFIHTTYTWYTLYNCIIYKQKRNTELSHSVHV